VGAAGEQSPAATRPLPEGAELKKKPRYVR
jgi:hypothetical protein